MSHTIYGPENHTWLRKLILAQIFLWGYSEDVDQKYKPIKLSGLEDVFPRWFTYKFCKLVLFFGKWTGVFAPVALSIGLLKLIHDVTQTGDPKHQSENKVLHDLVFRAILVIFAVFCWFQGQLNTMWEETTKVWVSWVKIIMGHFGDWQSQNNQKPHRVHVWFARSTRLFSRIFWE